MPLFSRALALPRRPHRAPSRNLFAPNPARPFTTNHKRLGDDTVSSFAKGSKLGGGETGSHALGPDSLLTKGLGTVVLIGFVFYDTFSSTGVLRRC